LRDSEFFLDGKRIYLLGVSEGVGSCSDLLGVYIAVFSENPGSAKAIPGRMDDCSYAALLRVAKEEEKEPYPDCSCMVVEGLALPQREAEYIEFVKDGTKAVYVNII